MGAGRPFFANQSGLGRPNVAWASQNRTTQDGRTLESISTGGVPQRPQVQREHEAGTTGAVGGNLEELLKGDAFAGKITEAFNAGATAVHGQIKDAFKDVIPPKIEMTGQLGVIKVHLTGGEILQKFNNTILETMDKAITKAITDTVKPDALKDKEGRRDMPNSAL